MAGFKRGDQVWLGKGGTVGWEVLRTTGDRVVIETVTGRGSQRRTVSSGDLTLRPSSTPTPTPRSKTPSGPAPIVARAVEYAETLRNRRAELLRQLTDVRNPQVRLRIGERTERRATIRKTREGQLRQAQAIRDQVRAEGVTAIGRARKAELVTALYDGPVSELLLERLNREQRRRFQGFSERIAAGSMQSVGILFRYAGGLSLYTEALTHILQSEPDVEGGLDILEQLSELAVSAAREYAPSRIGRLSI